MNEIIWNNKFLCVDKKSVFRRDLFSIGLLKIGDLLSCNNITTFSFTNLLLNSEQSFFVMSIIDSIPTHWRTIIKDSSSLPIISPVLDVPSIIIDGNPLTFSDVSSKQIYRQFLAKKQGLPTAQKKLSDKYPHSAIDWEKVYSLSFRSSMESKLREFQYKILNCIVFTNEKLFRFGIMQSPLLYVLSAKKRTNPSSIYSFPVRNLVNFGNMYCPGSGKMTLMLVNWRRLIWSLGSLTFKMTLF